MMTRKEEQILLGIVHLKDKAYLVTIRQKLKEITGRYMDVGGINKSLKKLEREGYLVSKLSSPTPVRGGKAIKFYALTERAWKALDEISTLQQKFWKNIIFPSRG